MKEVMGFSFSPYLEQWRLYVPGNAVNLDSQNVSLVEVPEQSFKQRFVTDVHLGVLWQHSEPPFCSHVSGSRTLYITNALKSKWPLPARRSCQFHFDLLYGRVHPLRLRLTFL